VALEPLTPHPRGVSVTIHTEARAGGDTVWAQSSTMLHRGEHDPDAPTPPGPPPTGELPAGARWRLPADLGRRYAAVSGDRNPIHLHGLTAKPFGFARPLAHGMWTHARCLAALGPQLPDAVTIEVAFRRPLLLPAVVSFAEAEVDGGAIAFGVRDADDGTPHLDGIARQSLSGASAAASGSAAAS
jgi:acyl dehydratase